MSTPLSPNSQAFLEMLEKQLDAEESSNSKSPEPSSMSFQSFSDAITNAGVIPQVNDAGKVIMGGYPEQAHGQGQAQTIGQSGSQGPGQGQGALPLSAWEGYMPQIHKLQELFRQQQQEQSQQHNSGGGGGVSGNNVSQPNQPQRKDSKSPSDSSSPTALFHNPTTNSGSSSTPLVKRVNSSGTVDESSPQSSNSPPNTTATQATQALMHKIAQSPLFTNNTKTSGMKNSDGNMNVNGSMMSGGGGGGISGAMGSIQPGGFFVPPGIMPYYGPTQTGNPSPPQPQARTQSLSQSPTTSYSGPSRHDSNESSNTGKANNKIDNTSNSNVSRRKSTTITGTGRLAPPEQTGDDTAMDFDHKRKAEVVDDEISGASHRRKNDTTGASSQRNSLLDETDDEDSDEILHSNSHGNGNPNSNNSNSKRKLNSKRKVSSGDPATSGGAGVDAASPADDAGARALKRKNQNRAAQKAFRERREARVKDLEDKVNELESRAYGQNIENENLRQLLGKLQQENMALKNSAFTFSMPVSSLTPVTTREGSMADPNQHQHQNQNQNHFNKSAPPGNDPHLPSPPLSSHTGSDRASFRHQSLSRSDNNSNSNKSSPAYSASLDASPPQAMTAGTQQVFNPDPFNAFATGGPQQQQPNAGHLNNTYPPQDDRVAAANNATGAFGEGNMNAQEIFDTIKDNIMFTSPAGIPSQAPHPIVEQQQQQQQQHPWTMLAQAPDSTSFRSNPAPTDLSFWTQPQPQPQMQEQEQDHLNDAVRDQGVVDDATMEAFLKSLTDPNDQVDPDLNAAIFGGEIDVTLPQRPEWAISPPAVGGFQVDPDAFNQYLWGNSPPPPPQQIQQQQQLLPPQRPAPTPGSSSSFANSFSMNSPFSSSNYITMSPETSSLSSAALAPTPKSNLNMPPSTADLSSEKPPSSSVDGLCQNNARIVRKDGTMLTASEVWDKVQSKVEFTSGFELDELCDSFKKKANCNGQGPALAEDKMEAIILDYVANRSGANV